ncbi:MAG: GNAT family N-acetyltransferase, partial [Caulobacteraceae bacterium]
MAERGLRGDLMGETALARLALEDMDAAARVHRAAFDHRLPWLSGLHTPAEDRGFYRDHIFNDCAVWGASDAAGLAGFIAFREDWVDQLYVLPAAQNRGVGSRLLSVAQAAFPQLSLWTFQRNTGARRFYEARGFVVVELTDGARNEEREPDML